VNTTPDGFSILASYSDGTTCTRSPWITITSLAVFHHVGKVMGPDIPCRLREKTLGSMWAITITFARGTAQILSTTLHTDTMDS
jgi:hypothetical protein